VQSLATQTARGTESPEEFRKAFEGRLIALSQAHDQLTRRHWKSADLRDIVEGATAPHLADAQDRIFIDGDPITVTPRVALTLALGLHELTTNASKYGSLSVPEGSVDVRWRIERPPGKPPVLAFEWRERGGPAVTVPARKGFGTRFIVGSVASELRGKADLAFNADGLFCTMVIPLDSVVPDFAASAHNQALPPR
jgi:two-component sensor histidine kinase